MLPGAMRVLARCSPALLSIVALAACGGGDGEPERATGPAKEVAAVIETLERATARRDFETICDRLFTAEVRERAGGEDCASLLRRTAARVRRPRIAIERIDVEGDSAVAEVKTKARGQAEASDTIRLVRERGRFRIASLGR